MAELLITPAEIIDRAIYDKSFDSGYFIDRYIESAQLNYLRPMLGSDFYDALIASPTTYSELLDMIRDMLAFYVVMDTLPIIHVHLGVGGIRMKNGEYSNTPGRDHRADLAATMKRYADEYADKLHRYLDDNDSTYPLYQKMTTNKLRGGIMFY